MASQMAFPNHIGLPGQPNPPAIDGFVEPDDFLTPGVFGSSADQVDPGWTEAQRLTYVADTVVGAGKPLVAFQGLKNNGDAFIYLGFVIRRDTNFDDQDRIILVFHPNFALGSVGKTGNERRIDILPNAGGVGAGKASDPPGTPPYSLRHNRDPRNVEYYKWDTGSSAWTSISPITNIAIKVRSWDLGTNNKNWSVEVQLPTSIAKGGADWIDFTTSFGFYFNVIRICSGTECTEPPTTFDGSAFQFTWPRTGGVISEPADVSTATIPASWLGQVFLPGDPGFSGVKGVLFHNAAAGIGVLSGSNILDTIDRHNPNTFVAQLDNTATTAAQAVTAEFRIANWGTGPGDFNKWNLIPGSPNPTTPQTLNGGASQQNLTMSWTLNTTQQNMYSDVYPTPAGKLNAHQCIWVKLDSVQTVDFVESSTRRNLNFGPLSEMPDMAEISGDGYPAPPSGPDHDFLLLTSQARRARLVKKGELGTVNDRIRSRIANASTYDRGGVFNEPGGLLGRLIALISNFLGQYEVVYDWLWVTDGYRKTADVMKVGGKRYQLYEATGSFGSQAEHVGLVTAFTDEVNPYPDVADRFNRTGPGTIHLKVPNGGAVRLATKLAAKEFNIPWWFWLLLPILLILWLLRRRK